MLSSSNSPRASRNGRDEQVERAEQRHNRRVVTREDHHPRRADVAARRRAEPAAQLAEQPAHPELDDALVRVHLTQVGGEPRPLRAIAAEPA